MTRIASSMTQILRPLKPDATGSTTWTTSFLAVNEDRARGYGVRVPCSILVLDSGTILGGNCL